jgi:hypothetical protein
VALKHQKSNQNPTWPPWTLNGCNIFDLFSKTIACQVTLKLKKLIELKYESTGM